MILRIVLSLSYGMLVSSNNGYPIIPTQTYPIYQQNGYGNPSANQPSDITPYLQSMMVQNQSPPLDLPPSNIRQILLNRILSGQPMQTTFHQNLIGYGSNLVDFPNNAMVPKAVNNYFAAPMINEYVNNQPTGANKEDKVADNKTEGKRKKHKNRKSSKPKRNHDSEKNQISSSKHDKTNNLQGDDKELSKKSKKRSRKLKTEAASHENTIENESNKKTKKKKRIKNKAHDVKNPVAEETKAEESKPRTRHKKKSKQDNAENIVSEQQITPKPNQIQEGINLAHFYDGIVEENRVPRNPIAEGKDLFKSIPNLPENIANSFNFKGLPQFNNPAMANFFANYENIYQSMMANNKGTNDQREVISRKPKRRNNNKTKIEVKNKNSTVTKATVPINPTKPVVSRKINIVTTEKTIYIIEKARTNIDPIPEDEGSKSSEKPSQVKEDIHEFENEEIKDMESNIKDPVLNYGYIDDYYPQFVDSAAYPTANNREVYIKNLGDTKYYYAVDKANPEFINRMRFEGFAVPERVTKDYEMNKKYDDAEKEGVSNTFEPDSKDIKEEVIHFRSPPQLEIPDFQTRKIERNEINSQPFYDFDENDDLDPRFLGNKAIYSKAKVPYYAGTKDVHSKEVQKDKHKDVETVFARSKVVNYGPVYNPEDDSTSGTCNEDLTDYTFKDGGITYVMATSLDYPEMFW